MALSNDTTNSNLELDNCSTINQFYIPRYNDLTQAFQELHKDMTSLCLKNKYLKLKASFLSKEIETLKQG